MVNKKAKEAVKKASFSKDFCRPLYDSYCFSKIPGTIKSLLGIESEGALPHDTFIQGSYDHVAFIFLDGFGWRFFEQYQARIPLLKRSEQEGIVSILTSLFPSTTAAHVTCINTGLMPYQSGVYEWFQYEPQLKAIVAPLLFSYARHKNQSLPIEPDQLYPFKTFYQILKEQGIDSYVLQPETISHSTYSQTLLKGATVMGYESLENAFNDFCRIKGNRTYRMFYFPDIDSIGHRSGTQAPKLFEALNTVCTHIEKAIQQLPPKTALFISADHGLMDVSPKRTYYLNQHIPNIEKFLLNGFDQKPLTPVGSCRDYFLHVKEERLDEMKEVLAEFLESKAEIYLISDLIEQGIFGKGSPLKRFTDRVGNLVILPIAEEAIWWHEKGRFQQNFYAAHGGLSREEMEIPFIFMAP